MACRGEGQALVPAAAAGEECLAAAAAAGAALDGAGAWGCPAQAGPGLQAAAGTHPLLAHVYGLHQAHLTRGREAPLAKGREAHLSLYAADAMHSQAHVAQICAPGAAVLGDGGQLGEQGWHGEPLRKRQATGSAGAAASGIRGVASEESVGLGPPLAVGLNLQGLAEFASHR